MEEQTATTNEMARSVQEAAAGATEIADEHHRRLDGRRLHHPGAHQTRTAVDELSRMAADLRTTVGRFTY